MIVWKGPCTVYDVDLAGALGFAALGLAAWWLAVVPWQQTWGRYRETAGVHAAAQKKLQKDVVELEHFQQQLMQLERVVSSQAAEVPRMDARARLLQQLTDIAKDAEVELLNVAPQPESTSGAYLTSDIQVAARGRSQDFMRFLDGLAQQNPYQSLRACSIVRPASAPEPTCELAWTVRLYLLPPAAEDRKGSAP